MFEQVQKQAFAALMGEMTQVMELGRHAKRHAGDQTVRTKQ